MTARKAPPKKTLPRRRGVPPKKSVVKRKTPKPSAPVPTEPEQLGLGIATDPAIVDILDDRLLMPSRVAALAFGISETALKKWKIKHRTQRGRETLYYLPDLIKYRVNRADSGENNLSIERARLARAQAEKTELEVLQLRGDLIPATVIAKAWQKIAGSVRQKVMGIKIKLKTQLPNLTSAEVKIIGQVCRDTLEEVSQSGIPKTGKKTTR